MKKKSQQPPPAKSDAELRDDDVAAAMFRVLQQGSARYAGGLPKGWHVDDLTTVQALREAFAERFPQAMGSLKTKSTKRGEAA